MVTIQKSCVDTNKSKYQSIITDIYCPCIIVIGVILAVCQSGGPQNTPGKWLAPRKLVLGGSIKLRGSCTSNPISAPP